MVEEPQQVEEIEDFEIDWIGEPFPWY